MRKELREFAKQMEDTLGCNDHKGGWDQETLGYLFSCMLAEMAELHRAIYHCDLPHREDQIRQIQGECVDVANFCMMLADNFGKGKYDTQGSV